MTNIDDNENELRQNLESEIWGKTNRQPTQSKVPASDESEVRRRQRKRYAEQKRYKERVKGELEKLYPLPKDIGLELCYSKPSHVSAKLCRIVKDEKGKRFPDIPIASPFGAFARYRKIDVGDAYGLRVHVQDMQGECRVVDFDRTELAHGTSQAIHGKLYAAGLRCYNDGQRHILDILRAVAPKREVLIVSKPGLHRYNGCTFFCTPTNDVIGAPEGVEIELDANLIEDNVERKRGTLKGWKDIVAEAVAVDNAYHWRLGAIVPFAGPILSLANMDTCGLNVSGLSSTGKTMGHLLASSAWGTPEVGYMLMRTWRSTTNAFECLGRISTGTVLALDDLSHADGKEVGKILYSLSGGAGKSRMSLKGGNDLQNTLTWRTLVISNGETSLRQKIERDNGTYQPGISVRFPDVDVSDVNREVPQSLIQKIKQGIHDNYGHAGTEFVFGLFEHGWHNRTDELYERVNCAVSSIVGDASGGMVRRAALPFALIQVAGELAVEYDILPQSLDVQDTIKWAWDSYCQSGDVVTLSTLEQIKECLVEWVTSRMGNTLKRLDLYDCPTAREAEAWYDDTTIYIPAKLMANICKEMFKLQLIGSTLANSDLLIRRDNGRATIGYVPGVGNMKSYAIDRKRLLGEKPCAAGSAASECSTE